MRILAAGAHPDDIEIFMFGLLSLFKFRGDEITMLVATDGSLGGKLKKEEVTRLREIETTNALKGLGDLFFLKLPDGSLGDYVSHKIKIKKKVLEISPDLIITHAPNDYHSDHQALSGIMKSIACHQVPLIYSDTMLGVNFLPNYYVDISKVFESKKLAVSKHISQQPERFLDLIEVMNSFRSAQCNHPKGNYAEAYLINNNFPFTDIRGLLPSAIKVLPFLNSEKKGFL